MTKRKGGLRRKTRHRFTKHYKQKGKIPISRYLQTFNAGDKVNLVIEPSLQEGIYFPMFAGKSGIIKNKKGRCYEVMIHDGNKEKTLIVHPVHLKRS